MKRNILVVISLGCLLSSCGGHKAATNFSDWRKGKQEWEESNKKPVTISDSSGCIKKSSSDGSEPSDWEGSVLPKVTEKSACKDKSHSSSDDEW